MIELQGEGELMKLLAAELGSIVWNDCIRDTVSAKLLFQGLYDWSGSSVLQLTNFNEVRKIVHNRDVVLGV